MSLLSNSNDETVKCVVCQESEPEWKAIPLTCCGGGSYTCMTCLVNISKTYPKKGVQANLTLPRCPSCRNDNVAFRTVLFNAKLISSNKVKIFRETPVSDPMPREQR